MLFYVFIAIGLLGVLTLSFIDSSREGAVNQSAQQLTETLYAQANTIRADILACVNKYPNSVDLDGDGDIDSNDNPNPPYPLSPTNVNNPGGAAAQDSLDELMCPGAPSGQQKIYALEGMNLPKRLSGISQWLYKNLGTGQVFIKVTSFNSNKSEVIAFERVKERFSACEADINDAVKCGTDDCLIVYLKRNGC